jgi:hypothetical protein
MRSSKRQVLFNKPDSTLRLSGANKSITGGSLAEGRTSSATFIDTDGLLKTAAANVPVWENGGLRHEGQRTNIIIYSEQIDNAAYLGGSAVTPNSTTAPDGNLTADLVTLAASGTSASYQQRTAVASTLYTVSFYVKLGTLASGNYKIAVYDATNLAFIASDIVPSVLPNASNFSRITYQFTTPSGCTSVRVYTIRTTDAAANNKTLYVFGVDLKTGYLSSYVPTTSAEVTSATCALSVPLVLNQNFYQKSAIVMRVRAKWANSATAKSWLTPSTTSEGLIDNGSGALTFVDSAANTATANLTSWAADTIILVAIVTDNVTGLMSLAASKDNGATWTTSADTAFAGLTVGANWLLFSANTQVFECLGWNVVKSNKGFAQMKAYAKANALRLTQ